MRFLILTLWEVDPTTTLKKMHTSQAKLYHAHLTLALCLRSLSGKSYCIPFLFLFSLFFSFKYGLPVLNRLFFKLPQSLRSRCHLNKLLTTDRLWRTHSDRNSSPCAKIIGNCSSLLFNTVPCIILSYPILFLNPSTGMVGWCDGPG